MISMDNKYLALDKINQEIERMYNSNAPEAEIQKAYAKMEKL